jgi:hypothetical protein
VEYQRDESGNIQVIIPADGLSVIYQATNVRNERTGVHATVSIGFRENGRGAVPMDEDTYNVGRREERERLVNGIFKNGRAKSLMGPMNLERMIMNLKVKMGAPSSPGFQLEQTFFGFKPEDRVQLHESIFNLIWWGDGRWDWDTIYTMPIFLRKFYISKINKMNRDREDEQERIKQEIEERRKPTR